MDWFPKAYSVEVAQLGFAVAGFALSLWAVRDVNRERHDLIVEKINGPRLTLALTAISAEILQLVVYLIFVIAGVAGCLLPPPDYLGQVRLGAEASEALSAVITRSAMTAATIALMTKTLTRRYGRYKYFRSLRKSGRSLTAQRRRIEDITGHE